IGATIAYIHSANAEGIIDAVASFPNVSLELIEKPQQAFYIVDQKSNNIDLLIQDSDYLKYLEQAKALFKKPQRFNQSVRMNRIKEGLNETQDIINQLADQLQKKMYIKKYGICEETGHSKGKCSN
ncbi:22401_t:CDS:2, partial [Cetraspora pellucida]